MPVFQPFVKDPRLSPDTNIFEALNRSGAIDSLSEAIRIRGQRKRQEGDRDEQRAHEEDHRQKIRGEDAIDRFNTLDPIKASFEIDAAGIAGLTAMGIDEEQANALLFRIGRPAESLPEGAELPPLQPLRTLTPEEIDKAAARRLVLETATTQQASAELTLESQQHAVERRPGVEKRADETADLQHQAAEIQLAEIEEARETRIRLAPLKDRLVVLDVIRAEREEEGFQLESAKRFGDVASSLVFTDSAGHEVPLAPDQAERAVKFISENGRFPANVAPGDAFLRKIREYTAVYTQLGQPPDIAASNALIAATAGLTGATLIFGARNQIDLPKLVAEAQTRLHIAAGTTETNPSIEREYRLNAEALIELKGKLTNTIRHTARGGIKDITIAGHSIRVIAGNDGHMLDILALTDEDEAFNVTIEDFDELLTSKRGQTRTEITDDIKRLLNELAVRATGKPNAKFDGWKFPDAPQSSKEILLKVKPPIRGITVLETIAHFRQQRSIFSRILGNAEAMFRLIPVAAARELPAQMLENIIEFSPEMQRLTEPQKIAVKRISLGLPPLKRRRFPTIVGPPGAFPGGQSIGIGGEEAGPSSAIQFLDQKELSLAEQDARDQEELDALSSALGGDGG